MSRLAPQPVAFYAAVFFLVNASYVALIWELIEREPAEDLSGDFRSQRASDAVVRRPRKSS